MSRKQALVVLSSINKVIHLAESVNMNSTSCETTPTIQVHSPLNCSDKVKASFNASEFSFSD